MLALCFEWSSTNFGNVRRGSLAISGNSVPGTCETSGASWAVSLKTLAGLATGGEVYLRSSLTPVLLSLSQTEKTGSGPL